MKVDSAITMARVGFQLVLIVMRFMIFHLQELLMEMVIQFLDSISTTINYLLVDFLEEIVELSKT